jgi:hypothetical protein
VQGIVDRVLLLLDFDLGRAADTDHRDPAGEFRQSFLQLFLVVIGGGLFDLCLDLSNTRLDRLFIAGAVEASPFDAMVAIWPISSKEPTFLARPSISFVTAATAMSIPRFKSIGFIPEATSLMPFFMIAAASTVAVVVPSPARSLVFEATSRRADRRARAGGPFCAITFRRLRRWTCSSCRRSPSTCSMA